MRRHPKRQRALIIGLSALAGYVDAVGYLHLGGFFVSFMSGNSTRLAIGLASSQHAILVAGGLIGLFVVGVVVGSLAGHFAGKRRRGPAVLGLVAVVLAGSAGLSVVDLKPAALGAMAFAMGAENAVFVRYGEANIGVTYMTGMLVKLGQHIAYALLGGDRLGWIAYLLPWLGMIAGAVCGAFAYPALGLNALWPAAGAAAALAILTAFLPIRWSTGKTRGGKAGAP